MSKLNVLNGTDICDPDYSINLNHSDSNENSANEIEDNADEFNLLINEKKHLSDTSSDESQKTDANEPSCNLKNGKKPHKPKVKIKTLTIDGQLVYFCKICDKIFTRRKDKLNHELAHSGESMLICNECGKEYLHESSLASHMRTHDGDPLFMCDLCPKMFAQSHHLKSHILSHSEPTNFVCKTCYMEFATSADLNHHCRIQIKMEMTKLWCKMCKVYFCRNHDSSTERRIHAFCCSACNELFYTSKKLKIHMKRFAHFSAEKPKYIEPLEEYELYPDKVSESIRKQQVQKDCESGKNQDKRDSLDKKHCEVSFGGELPLKKFKLSIRKVFLEDEHSSTSLQDSAPEIKQEIEIKSPIKHRKGKPYCKKCNKSFKDSEDLHRHRALLHEDKHDNQKCGTCKMGFLSKRELENHSLIHAGQRSHSCPVCGESFSCSLELTKHLKAHVEDFPYKCSQCGRGFRLKIQLIQHVRLHVAQDGKLTESGSGKVAATENLELHVEKTQVQGQGDIYKCHLCSKTFPFRYKLLNHLRLHTNVKCFQCYICHKAFATKHYLQRHLQVHVKQGMDVDVQNIIVDEDSKTELDSVRTQLARDNPQRKGVEVPFRHRFGCRNFKRRRKASAESETCENLNEQTATWPPPDESKLSIHRCDNIKIECQDGSDSGSGHSCCSSLTRDSDRSDPFRFSSDGSNSFKTTMAKERRRLRRRWFRQMKRNRMKLKRASGCRYQISCPSLVKEKEREDNDDNGDDVVDMMVELNGVQSEMDNVMTVYVDLTQMKSGQKPLNCSGPETKIEKTHRNNNLAGLPPLATPIKLEADWEREETLVEMESSSQFPDDTVTSRGKKCDNESRGKNCDNASRGNDFDTASRGNNSIMGNGKTLLFEIDAELFEDGRHEGENDEAKISLDPTHDCVDKQVKTEKALLQREVKFEESTLPESQKAKLPYESQRSRQQVSNNGKCSSSDLEKLTAAFECSSKFLPVSESSSDHCPKQSQNLHIQKSPLGSNAHDSKLPTVTQISQKQSVDEKHSHNSPQLPNRQISVLSMRSDHISDHSKRELTRSDLDVRLLVSSLTGTRPKFSSQETNRSLSATRPEMSISGKAVCGVVSHSVTPSSYSSAQGSVTQVTHSSALKVTVGTLGTVAAGSMQISAFPAQSDTVLATSGGGYTRCPPSGVNVSSSQKWDESHLNVNASSGVNTTPIHSPGLTQNLISCSEPGHANIHSNYRIPNASSSQSSSIAGNPFITSATPSARSTCSLGPGGSQADASIRLNPDHGQFSLNISSIFDTNNPVHRNMNMMDLVSPTHSINSPNVSQSSAQPQLHSVYTSNLSVASSQPQLHSAYTSNLSVASSQPQLHSAYTSNLSVASSQPQLHSAYTSNLSVASSQPQLHSVYTSNLSVASSQPQLHSAYAQNLSVASLQPQHAGSTLALLEQNSMEAQMRHSLVTMAELQSATFIPQNTQMNIGNPCFGVNLGNNFQTALNQGFDISSMALNSGSLESMVLSMAQAGSTDFNIQLRSLQESAYRESILGANVGFIPSLPVNINPYGGTLSFNPAINFSSGSGGYVGPAPPLGGQGFLNLCGQGVNTHLSLGAGQHLASSMTGLSNGFTPSYPLMGVQDGLTNTSAPFGINILNPSAPAPGGVMSTNPLSMMGNFNAGYFTSFP